MNFILIKNVPDKKELDSRIDKLVNKRVRELEYARKGILSPSKGGFLSYLEHKALLGSFEELLDLDVLKSAINSCLLSQF